MIRKTFSLGLYEEHIVIEFWNIRNYGATRAYTFQDTKLNIFSENYLKVTFVSEIKPQIFDDDEWILCESIFSLNINIAIFILN